MAEAEGRVASRPPHRHARADLCALGLLAALALAGCGGRSVAAPRAVAPDTAARSSLEAAQQISALHGRWREALAKRDTAFLSRLLVDNFQLTGGAVALTKPQFLAAVASDSGGAAPSQYEQTSVRLYDDVAVVTGLIRYDLPGEAVPALSRYTEVWVRESGEWHAAHLHYNPVPTLGQGGRR
jgi:ketosteroid isomerase-like protein